VSSNHAKQVLQASTFSQVDQATQQVIRSIKLEKPVEVLFEGVDLNKYFYIAEEDLVETDLVADLDSIEEEFSFLYVGHWLQGEFGEDRKNTSLLIKMFLETFKDKKNKPALILKTSHGGACIMDREEVLKKIDVIKSSVIGKSIPNIYVIHGDLDDADINDLYNHPKVKAFVSLTKGEGYGRPFAEFCLSKKPVIASGWSGHLDFLNPEMSVLVPGTITKVHPSAVSQGLILAEASWFSPDHAAASKALLDVFSNYAKYEAYGKRQAHKIKTEFSYDSMALLLKTYLDNYVPKQVQLVLPKLKKIN
jgi:glycosyltransferase involved in cell wall biosynthesis